MELAGYTYRVATMLEVFEDCSAGRYQRNIVKSTKQGKKALHHSEAEQVRTYHSESQLEGAQAKMKLFLKDSSNIIFSLPEHHWCHLKYVFMQKPKLSLVCL